MFALNRMVIDQIDDSRLKVESVQAKDSVLFIPFCSQQDLIIHFLDDLFRYKLFKQPLLKYESTQICGIPQLQRHDFIATIFDFIGKKGIVITGDVKDVFLDFDKFLSIVHTSTEDEKAEAEKQLIKRKATRAAIGTFWQQVRKNKLGFSFNPLLDMFQIPLRSRCFPLPPLYYFHRIRASLPFPRSLVNFDQFKKPKHPSQFCFDHSKQATIHQQLRNLGQWSSTLGLGRHQLATILFVSEIVEQIRSSPLIETFPDKLEHIGMVKDLDMNSFLQSCQTTLPFPTSTPSLFNSSSSSNTSNLWYTDWTSPALELAYSSPLTSQIGRSRMGSVANGRIPAFRFSKPCSPFRVACSGVVVGSFPGVGKTAECIGSVMLDWIKSEQELNKIVSSSSLCSSSSSSLPYEKQFQRIFSRATIVCAPDHLLHQWKGEIKKWWPSAPILLIGEDNKRNIVVEQVVHSAFLLMSPSTLSGFFQETSKRKTRTKKSDQEEGLTHQSLVSSLLVFHFRFLVLDEQHEIVSDQAQFMRLLTRISTNMRYAISATPFAEREESIAGLLEFIGMRVQPAWEITDSVEDKKVKEVKQDEEDDEDKNDKDDDEDKNVYEEDEEDKNDDEEDREDKNVYEDEEDKNDHEDHEDDEDKKATKKKKVYKSKTTKQTRKKVKKKVLWYNLQTLAESHRCDLYTQLRRKEQNHFYSVQRRKLEESKQLGTLDFSTSNVMGACLNYMYETVYIRFTAGCAQVDWKAPGIVSTPIFHTFNTYELQLFHLGHVYGGCSPDFMIQKASSYCLENHPNDCEIPFAFYLEQVLLDQISLEIEKQRQEVIQPYLENIQQLLERSRYLFEQGRVLLSIFEIILESVVEFCTENPNFILKDKEQSDEDSDDDEEEEKHEEEISSETWNKIQSFLSNHLRLMTSKVPQRQLPEIITPKKEFLFRTSPVLSLQRYVVTFLQRLIHGDLVDSFIGLSQKSTIPITDALFTRFQSILKLSPPSQMKMLKEHFFVLFYDLAHEQFGKTYIKTFVKTICLEQLVEYMQSGITQPELRFICKRSVINRCQTILLPLVEQEQKQILKEVEICLQDAKLKFVSFPQFVCSSSLLPEQFVLLDLLRQIHYCNTNIQTHYFTVSLKEEKDDCSLTLLISQNGKEIFLNKTMEAQAIQTSSSETYIQTYLNNQEISKEYEEKLTNQLLLPLQVYGVLHLVHPHTNHHNIIYQHPYSKQKSLNIPFWKLLEHFPTLIRNIDTPKDKLSYILNPPPYITLNFSKKHKHLLSLFPFSFNMPFQIKLEPLQVQMLRSCFNIDSSCLSSSPLYGPIFGWFTFPCFFSSSSLMFLYFCSLILLFFRFIYRLSEMPLFIGETDNYFLTQSRMAMVMCEFFKEYL